MYFVWMTLMVVNYSCSKETSTTKPLAKNEALINRTSNICAPILDNGCLNQFGLTGSIIYGGCNLTYTYNKQTCPGGGGVLWGLVVNPIPTYCQLYSSIQQALANNDLELVRTYYNLMYSSISMQIENQFANSFATNLDLQCDGGGLSFSTEFIATACIALCITFKSDGSGLIFTEINCGEACCRRTSSYCFQGSNLVNLGISYGPEVTCQVNPGGPTVFCGNQSMPSTLLPCKFSCERIYPEK